MNLLDTKNLKQLGMLALILLLCFTVADMMFAFFPGVLGAITMYILMRRQYMKLVYVRKWKPWKAAALFVIAAIVIFATPIYLLFLGIIPKLNILLAEGGQLTEIINAIIYKLRSWHIPVRTNSEQQVLGLFQNLVSSAPLVLGATFNLLTNALLAFFFLYFMLVQGKEMENAIKDFMPLKRTNVNELWDATRVMVKSNAIGIPILAASQALVAIIGYWIFGVKSFIFWGLITGVFSVVPLIGCAIVWIPLCIFLMVSGQTGQSLGLAAYSFAITGSVDNILRFTILKKLGNVHPIVTTVGVIVGVPLFGFMGFIFGPLLVSYLILLIKVYRVEFTGKRKAEDKTVGKVEEQVT